MEQTTKQRSPVTGEKVLDKIAKDNIKLKTSSGFINDTLDLLYKIGFEVEYTTVRWHRNVKVVFFLLKETTLSLLSFISSILKNSLSFALKEFSAPFRELKRAKNNIEQIKQQEGHYGKQHVRTRAFLYVTGGIRKHLHLTKNPLFYIMPLVAFSIFGYTVYSILNQNFLLEVSYNDEILGLIPNETIFESAQQQVKSRIIYQDNEEKWDIKPQYSIQMTSSDATEEDTRLADAIIAKSGKEIVGGTGFYVDNQFIGATLDKLKLEDDIDNVLSEYKVDDPNIVVAFAKDVAMVDGLFLASSVVDNDEIKSYLTRTEGEEKTYTVEQNESIAEIAAENGITAKELIENNPVLDTKAPQNGQVLVISKPKHILPVKTIETITYEEEIPFETIKTPSDKYQTGTRKVEKTGKNGLKNVTAELVRVDGELIETNIVGTEVLIPEINEEITYGTAVVQFDGNLPSLGSGVMQWPTGAGVRVSRGFSGVYAHNGIDIAGPHGTPILAADNGVVTSVVYSGVGYGIHLIINHGNGTETLYGHNSAIHIGVGQQVTKGQVVASMGSTGNSTGNHIHFEVIIGGTRVDPAPYIY